MACRDKNLQIYADNVPLVAGYKDMGCNGETRRFHAVTDLDGDVSYRWSLDGISPVLGTKSYFDYTHDTTNHVLYLMATGTGCGIQKTVRLSGVSCVDCAVRCRQTVVTIPAGDLISLKDINGQVYPIIAGAKSACLPNQGTFGAAAIKRAIRERTNCNLSALKVFAYHNQTSPNCITLTIYNSPIIFESIKVGKSVYTFDTQNCEG